VFIGSIAVQVLLPKGEIIPNARGEATNEQ
jgi:hypothetical protein